MINQVQRKEFTALNLEQSSDPRMPCLTCAHAPQHTSSVLEIRTQGVFSMTSVVIRFKDLHNATKLLGRLEARLSRTCKHYNIHTVEPSLTIRHGGHGTWFAISVSMPLGAGAGLSRSRHER